MDLRPIGQYIKLKRIEKGLTQDQLAELLGVQTNTVSRWERGVYIPDMGILEDLAAKLETDPISLLCGQDVKQSLIAQRKEPIMEKHFVYQKYDLKNIIGILVGAAIAGVLLLVIEIVFKILGPNQYTAAVMSIVFLTVFICFPKVIWPKVSSGMSCFYGVGSYKIEVGHLGITMGKRSYSFFDIDEVYLTGPQEGGGSMQGGVTTFDGSLEIKEGKRKLQIVTWNSYVVNTDTYSVISLFDDIKEYFPSLKPVLMDNGTEIRGYLRKEIDNGC